MDASQPTQLVSAAGRLRQQVASGRLLIAPGVYDGLSARLAERAGAQLLYASGGAIARAAAFPDLGLLAMPEMRDAIARICAAVRVPVIADADTGYGNALNVVRTVREFARAGVAALHLEDQVEPKRCGHDAGKALISAEEMCGKIRAALDGRDGDLVVIARTDAIAVTGLDDALRRAALYAQAGADMLFVEAPVSREQVMAIGQALGGVPLLINLSVGGPTPLMAPRELERLGYRVLIAPSDLQRAAQRAMARAAEALLREGSSQPLADDLVSLAERDEAIGKGAWDQIAARYGARAGG